MHMQPSDDIALQIHIQDSTNTATNFSQDSNDYRGYPTMLCQVDHSGYIWEYLFNHRKARVIIPPKEVLFWNVSDPSQSTTSTENNRNLWKVNGTRHSSAASIFTRLIASQYSNYSAKDLSEDNYSDALDFFSLAEGIFCDMELRLIDELAMQLRRIDALLGIFII